MAKITSYEDLLDAHHNAQLAQWERDNPRECRESHERFASRERSRREANGETSGPRTRLITARAPTRCVPRSERLYSPMFDKKGRRIA